MDFTESSFYTKNESTVNSSSLEMINNRNTSNSFGMDNNKCEENGVESENKTVPDSMDKSSMDVVQTNHCLDNHHKDSGSPSRPCNNMVEKSSAKDVDRRRDTSADYSQERSALNLGYNTMVTKTHQETRNDCDKNSDSKFIEGGGERNETIQNYKKGPDKDVDDGCDNEDFNVNNDKEKNDEDIVLKDVSRSGLIKNTGSSNQIIPNGHQESYLPESSNVMATSVKSSAILSSSLSSSSSPVMAAVMCSPSSLSSSSSSMSLSHSPPTLPVTSACSSSTSSSSLSSSASSLHSPAFVSKSPSNAASSMQTHRSPDPCSPILSSGFGPPSDKKSAFCSLGSVDSTRKGGSGTQPAYSRSLPIHCIIQQAASQNESEMSSDDLPVDTYAILPGSTLFSDIIRASLLRLGYSSSEVDGAVGGIQLKNWRTLPFDVVTDRPDATVEELLGEIISVATLRIRLVRSRSSSGDQVKEKLLQLLLTQSKDFLVETGCPIEKNLLDAISKGQVNQTISEQVCAAFNLWYGHQTQGNQSQKEASLSIPDEKTDKTPASLSQSSERNPSSLPVPYLSSSSLTKANKVSGGKDDCNSSLTPSSSSSSSSVSSIQSCLFTSASSKGRFPGEEKKTLSSSLSPSLMSQPEKTKIKRESSPLGSRDGHDNSNFWAHQNSHQSIKREHLNSHNHQNVHHHAKQSEHLSESVFSPPANETPMTLNFAASNTTSQASSFMGIMPGKTRIRTSFDPEHEIPRLQKWFSHNQHPTRDQMMKFMQELNRLESRKGRRPLDLTNIIYWFKNARAAQRRATKAADDSFESEEKLNSNECSEGNLSEPPYLPNKNAVYMIPFPPYPHLVSGQANPCAPDNMSGVDLAGGCDEPYDLSIAKHSSPPSDPNKSSNKRSSDHINSNSYYNSHSPSSKTSVESTDEDTAPSGEPPKKRMATQCQPRLPALLDVVSRMRREIPSQSEDPIKTLNQRSSSPNHYRPRSADTENISRIDDFESGFSESSSLRHNGCAVSSPSSPELQISMDNKSEEGRYSSDQMCSRPKTHVNFERDSDLELGQIKKENGHIPSNNNNKTPRSNNVCSDDENSNDSYDSEEELKMRMKQNAVAVADYMNSNVSRLTAANMAALSLAQMGQSLHIPQLPPSLAMAYYPMDPRFYSQASVPTSMHHTSSSPPPLPPSSSSHLTPRQGQTTPTSHLDSPCPLPSPSSLHHSMAELNHQRQRHHHQQHQQQQHHQQDQQHSDQHHQQQSMRSHSEPRKRRTRVFIDPLSEIPKLEKWFIEDTHPSAFMIDKYCEELNKCEYRQKFPKLEPKNVQLWFKNHRAKVKRLTVSFNGKVEDDVDGEDMQMDGKKDGMRNDSSRWMMGGDENDDSSQNFELKQEIAG